MYMYVSTFILLKIKTTFVFDTGSTNNSVLHFLQY